MYCSSIVIARFQLDTVSQDSSEKRTCLVVVSAERSIEAVDSFIPGVDPAQLYIRPLLNGPLRPATRQECESHEQRCVPLSGGALEEDFRSAPENEANCVRVQSLLGIDGMRRSTPDHGWR